MPLTSLNVNTESGKRTDIKSTGTTDVQTDTAPALVADETKEWTYQVTLRHTDDEKKISVSKVQAHNIARLVEAVLQTNSTLVTDGGDTAVMTDGGTNDIQIDNINVTVTTSKVA